MIMRQGSSRVNDRIRSDIEADYPDIIIEDIAPHYSIRTFNRCVEKNTLLLSLECWNGVHPGLVSVPLREDYALPYGILTAGTVSAELEEFIRILKECLSDRAGAKCV